MIDKTIYPGLIGQMSKKQRRNLALTCTTIILLFVFFHFLQNGLILDNYGIRIFNLCLIYSLVGLSLNLIQGYTGQFSLGSAGFMAIGAYATTLLTLTPEVKETLFYLDPIVPWLANIHLPFLAALLLGGILTAFSAFLIGIPVFRLKGDYLSVATLGFSEIIRILLVNLQKISNGTTGLKNIPDTANIWWTGTALILAIVFMIRIFRSSYGRAFKAIRNDEFAAEAIGISLMRHKLLAFCSSAFMAGIAGGLMASVVGAINPNLFRQSLSNDILLIIVLGGTGTITGSILGGFIFVIAKEALRFLDNGFSIGAITFPAIAGLRMVFFSLLLMVVVLFFQKGLAGGKEFSWERIINLPKRVKKFIQRLHRGDANG
ncbi:MAG: branched-chain amino acid ABC transporter permease [Lachnospiraceae bacterium]|nr:branched-chain amino acid ABC transporter permease [Lachnospiraceae bacterium]